ncbi:cob(I)yrinic acid a,c-diamide adenosyltransferase [Ancylobacter dichloromethanicus]|uniref:Corrinoid adenosyltransferase n=1 Tax=Ancylobacter dichloromethanicus TaxID=518825 RepID=A0A9W6N0D1_9HYPH|nr:cob(I)yrinic acid a,c-diamide adenosyltransferase [Ancylobacter dichloromethanicus]MBS7553266.1 cob(I)yrinic acid a,c-diamide adenosyltransferase [Ancylobacter dichloromethanicus]GLK73046.1 cob(I)yrinic acid a,c-diamide adenosyltransferase [Ancylobacter dichloromethanicus]
MVVLNRIYTRTGDDGTTALGTGERRPKYDLRVAAYGTVDETNAVIGVARLHTGAAPVLADMEAMLARVQNDLFDLGADLATPETGEDLGYEPLRIVASQVDRLERDIDTLNAGLKPLRSFVLPAGTPAAAHLHVARTVCRRAERLAVELSGTLGEFVAPEAMKYLNRLSDLLFVMSRVANARAAGEAGGEIAGDVLWVPAAGRGD